ncbi:hypothetical protein THIOM_002230 [Candidatus Thiomargarita nelsonii]|uniref:Transposase n=1 Tax=Candidatus Thiomargarita nelsonii TaxID=1003181 RepID=A0A176S223_9GAMM|nr:hypothetical protein THIOM_002230 [Candidatus Thiomargarita nelsonii]
MFDEYGEEEIKLGEFKKGEEKGFDKGFGEGKEEGKMETARNLKALGISEEQIASATGLSLDQVRAL